MTALSPQRAQAASGTTDQRTRLGIEHSDTRVSHSLNRATLNKCTHERWADQAWELADRREQRVVVSA